MLFTSDFPGFGESYWYLYWCSSTGILSLVALNIFNLPWFFRGLIMFRYVFIWVSPILSLFSFFKLCACSVAQLCLTFYDPMDCNPPGSSVHGIFQAKILEWVAMPSSRDLFNPEIEPVPLMSPTLAGGFSTTSTTREA